LFVSNAPPEVRDYPHRVELASDYLIDSKDFLAKFDALFFDKERSFQEVKSLRTKCYVDLHQSIETLLKSVVCLRMPRGFCGVKLVRHIRSYSHNIKRLSESALKDTKLSAESKKVLEDAGKLDVQVRYGFDSMNLRMGNDALYYETVGNDAFIFAAKDFVARGQERLGKAFITQKSIFSGEDIIASIKRKNEYF
jgi:hypothetical protein